MAKLDQKILGKISGSLGDITFRQRNGKNYVASRPSKYTSPQDADTMERRSRFALSVKLASVINSIPQLKEIWISKIPSGSSVFNYLVKTNYRLVSPESVTDSTCLTPASGFGLSINSINIDSENINVVLNAIGTRTGIDTEVEKNIMLVSVLCLSSPSEVILDKSLLLPLISEPQPVALDSQLTFALELTSQAGQLFDKYADKKFIFALVTIDDGNNAVHYSNTFSN